MSQLPYALSQAEIDVLDERRAQRTREGFFPEHDDKHVHGEMGKAAVCYVIDACAYHLQPGMDDFDAWWPWETRWWKPGTARRMLVKAAALILAEIERRDRAEARKGGAL